MECFSECHPVIVIVIVVVNMLNVSVGLFLWIVKTSLWKSFEKMQYSVVFMQYKTINLKTKLIFSLGLWLQFKILSYEM